MVIRAMRLLLVIITPILLIVTLAQNCAFAQQSNLHAIYFQNQYLANPAMAGFEKGLIFDIGYQQQTNSVPGSPKLQSFAVDYNAGNNVGLGFNLSSAQIGLIDRTRFLGTYAYHLPVNETDKLNFGLSLGLNDTYIDYSKIVGDQGDLSVARFNRRAIYVDGDFGISYTNKKFTVQGALPNIKSIFFKETDQELQTDRSVFYTAVSYKFEGEGQNNIIIEPKVAYRGIKGLTNIFDAGGQIDLADYNINVSGMYHSNQSATFAFGLNLPPVNLMMAYTANTGTLLTYASSIFEIGLQLKLMNKP